MLRAGRAALFALGVIGYPRTRRVLSLPPLIWLVEISYWILSRNRPFFSRFLFTEE